MEDEFATDYTVEFPHPKPTHSFRAITQTVHNAVSAAIGKHCDHLVNFTITV